MALQNDAGVFYLHNDHPSTRLRAILGSGSVGVDDGGALVARRTYYPFGGIRTSEGTAPTDYGFTGQRFDASSALMYYGARYYDPQLGRFTQADPVLADAWNPQGLNRYAYVYNNPVRYSDPSGYRLEEGCGCDIPPDPAPLPPRYEDPSKYGDPPEPGEPPAPVEKCHRACKDDAGPSQPKETPTPPSPSAEDRISPCGPHAIDCDRAQQLFQYGLQADQLTLELSAVGEGMALGGTLLGAATCSETGVGLLGCAIGGYALGNGLANLTVDTANNITSAAGFAATAASDYYSGETRLENGTLIVGQNTAASAVTTLAGFLPDATVNLGASGLQYWVNDTHQIARSDLPGPLQLVIPSGPLKIPLP